MKKKAIEKIPYLTLPACYPDGEVLYIGRTAWHNIGHERHIILEVYENRKDCLQVPVVRYAATKKDWGVYDTEDGTWSGRKIDSNIWGYGMCWYDERLDRHETYSDMPKRNRLYSEDDLSRIKKYFKDIKIWNDERWWGYFTGNEEKIKNAARCRKDERRRGRLEERNKNTPKLDEKALLDWAEDHIFHRGHYLYYKKRGRRADLCCSACGGTYSGKWKAGESYESQFEHYIQEPREGLMGSCILCGEHGIYKPQGKARRDYRMRGHAFLADRYLEKGVVLRYIELGKEWILEEICGEKGLEMHGAYEKTDGIEIARTYFRPGKKQQTDFHKHDPYIGKDFWDDCNLYGMNNINISDAPVHPVSFENMKGTFLQYSALKEYASAKGELNAKEYLERYIDFPQIEMLVKMKLYQVVAQMVRGYCGIIADPMAHRPDRFLGIRKDKVKFLMEEQGNIGILNILKKEKSLGQYWTGRQVRELAEMNADNKNLGMALQVMSIQKLLNNVKRYAGCDFGTGCSTAESRLRATADTYFDYLHMRNSLGYDMNNTVYQRPRDIDAAHDAMMAELNKEKMDERLRVAAEKFPDIKKNYRKLRKRFFYEDDTFLIRPARSAEEIVTEGQVLHHCVGGDNYLDKHNRGYSYILMLRFKEMPEIPYITVEIDDTDRIVQWYGKHDKKPDRENMQKWLDIYVTRLRAGRIGIKEKTEKEAMEQMLMAAV
ncbi:MAG: hypothetical protein HDQ96_04670 [Lachnospiraceae bacterium]|nr:hypothetical protein [Lachnospiraceae bacterium]